LGGGVSVFLQYDSSLFIYFLFAWSGMDWNVIVYLNIFSDALIVGSLEGIDIL